MADNNYGKRMGDRKEGRQVRGLDALTRMAPYIMRKRSDACCSFSDSVEVSGIAQWLLAKRREGYRTMGLLHLMAAAYVRTAAAFPVINRFVAGRRVFARSDIQIILSVQRGQAAGAARTHVKVFCTPTDTVFDVYRRINEAVDEVEAGGGGSSADKLAESLARIPRMFLRWVMGILRLMDYFDWIPRGLLDDSPFHGSLSVSNMGLLGVGPVTHHIYDFGTLPCFLSIGAQRKTWDADAQDHAVERRWVDYRFTYDERIADAGALTDALKYFRQCLTHPQQLEQPPERPEDDIN